MKKKRVGKRKPSSGGLEASGGFLNLVRQLREQSDRLFIPRGVHRFKTFEEAEEWSKKMIVRKKKNPGRPA